MIKRFDTTTNPILSSVVDNIDASLECPKFRQMTNKIAVSVPESTMFGRPQNKEIAKKGFGTCLIKSYGYGFWDVDIVIDMSNCTKANLNEREITAVVYHELGHILNEPDLEQEPTFEFCFIHQIQFNRELLDNVRASNCLKADVFADSYANKHGYGKELVSSFYRQNLHFEQKIGNCETRITKIHSIEYFEGKIMSIASNYN